ncbi:MAG TPA: methyltransferase [Clostridia bacterium]
MNPFPTGAGERENQTVFPFSYTDGSCPVPLYDGETVEDLQRDGFRLIQKAGGFRFGEDSVLLAHHAAAVRLPADLRAVDLGCGCGLIAVMLCALLPGAHVTGIERLPLAAHAAARNLLLNGLAARARILTGDIRDPGVLTERDFDLAVCNPPYQEPGRGAAPSDPVRAAAMQEGELSIEELVLAARRLLRPFGTLALVHRPGRLPDLLQALRAGGLEPHSLREVLSRPGLPASVILVTAVKGARPGGFSILPPLVMREPDGRFTYEAGALYGNSQIDPGHLMDGLVRVPECEEGNDETGGVR